MRKPQILHRRQAGNVLCSLQPHHSHPGYAWMDGYTHLLHRLIRG